MAWTDLFGFGSQEDEAPEEQPEPEVVAAPNYATVDQMQQMVQGVAAQLQENLVGLIRGGGQQEVQPTFTPIPEPSLDQINEAYDNGDTKLALQLQTQREAAREQRYQAQLYQLRQEGATAFADLNNQMLTSNVPEYKRYEKDVQKKLDELGIKDPGTRANAKIVKLLTDAVKGERIDEIIKEREEAAKRQANDVEMGDLSSARRGQYSAPPKAVISEEAELALRFLGKDKEQFAKARGHGSWSDYEKSASAFQAVKRGEGSYVPKWRRNK